MDNRLWLLVTLVAVLSFYITDTKAQCDSCLEGQTKCQFNSVLGCIEVSDGCFDWEYQVTEQNFCPFGCSETGSGIAVCNSGPTSCQNLCNPGSSRCEGNSIVSCLVQDTGCYAWDTSPTTQIDCGSDACIESGSKASCQSTAPSCRDECLDGQTVCGGITGDYVQFCGEYDSDSCLEFPPSISTADDMFCEFGCQRIGSGVASCRTEPASVTECNENKRCDVENEQVCDPAGDNIITCKVQSNSCLEWDDNNITYCNLGCQTLGSGLAECITGASENLVFVDRFDLAYNGVFGEVCTSDTGVLLFDITTDGELLWATQDCDNGLVVFNLSNRGRFVYNLTDPSGPQQGIPSGITKNGANLWVSGDQTPGRISRFNLNYTYLTFNFSTATDGAIGFSQPALTSNDTYIWVMENAHGTLEGPSDVFIYYINNGTLIEQMDINIGGRGLRDTKGLDIFDGFLYAVEGNTSLLKRFATFGNDSFMEDIATLSDFGFTNVSGIDITSDGVVYVFDQEDSTLGVFTLEDFVCNDRCIKDTTKCISQFPLGKTTRCIEQPNGCFDWSQDPSDINECTNNQTCSFNQASQTASCVGITQGECPFSSEFNYPGECPFVGHTECVDSTFYRECVQDTTLTSCNVWSNNLTSCGANKCERGVCLGCIDQCNTGDQTCATIQSGGATLITDFGVQHVPSVSDPFGTGVGDEFLHYVVNCTNRNPGQLVTSACNLFANPLVPANIGTDATLCMYGCTQGWNATGNTTTAECLTPSDDALDFRNYLVMQSQNMNIIAGSQANKIAFIMLLMGVTAGVGFFLSRDWIGGMIPGLAIFMIGLASGWLPPVFAIVVALLVGLVIARMIFGFGE